MVKKFSKDIVKYMIVNFLFGLLFFSGILVPFYQEFAKLSFFQIALIEGIGTFTVFLLVIPTGVFADRYGRKRSLLIGLVLLIISLVIKGVYPSFIFQIISCMFVSIEEALFMGAEESLIYEILKRDGKEEDFQTVFSYTAFIFFTGKMISGPLGSFFAMHYGMQSPVLLSIIPITTATILLYSIKEPQLITPKDRRTDLSRIFLGGIKFIIGDKQVRIASYDWIIASTIGSIIILIYQPYLETAGIEFKYLGIVFSLISIAQMIMFFIYPILAKTVKTHKLINVLNIICGISLLSICFTHNIYIIVLLLLIAIGITCTRAALIITIINPLIPSSFRATVFSIIIMVENLVFALLSPLTGLSLKHMKSYVFLLFGIIILLSFLLIKGFKSDNNFKNIKELEEDFSQDALF